MTFLLSRNAQDGLPQRLSIDVPERNELFSALDKIADDPAGGDAYIHAIRTAMNTHLPHRLSAVLSPKRRRSHYGLIVFQEMCRWIKTSFFLFPNQDTPSFDEKDTPLRWVQRVFISASLWNHRNLNQVEERIFSI